MIKRLFDIFISFFGLLFFSPILIIVIFLIWIEDKKSPFYITQRLGKGEKQQRIKISKVPIAPSIDMEVLDKI